jgi:hypothetical protein
MTQAQINLLKSFDTSKLDNYETFVFNDMIKKHNKETVLEILINNVEGDFTQLSPGLKKLAKAIYK